MCYHAEFDRSVLKSVAVSKDRAYGWRRAVIKIQNTIMLLHIIMYLNTFGKYFAQHWMSGKIISL